MDCNETKCKPEIFNEDEFDYMGVVLSLLYASLGALMIVECFFTVYINRKHAEVRTKKAKVFTDNLAASNFIFGIIIVINCIPRLVRNDLRFKDHFDFKWCQCMFTVMSLRTLHTVSTLNFGCIALDRYVAICHPLRYHEILPKRLCYRLSAGTWLFTLLLFLPPAYIAFTNKHPDVLRCVGSSLAHEFHYTYIVVFVLTVSVIILFLFRIFLEFKGHNSNNSVMSVDNLMAEADRRIRKKTAIAMMKVIVFYIITSFPDVLFLIWTQQFSFNHLIPLYIALPVRILQCVHFAAYLPVYAWNHHFYRDAMQMALDYVMDTLCCSFAGSTKNMTPTKTMENVKIFSIKFTTLDQRVNTSPKNLT